MQGAAMMPCGAAMLRSLLYVRFVTVDSCYDAQTWLDLLMRCLQEGWLHVQHAKRKHSAAVTEKLIAHERRGKGGYGCGDGSAVRQGGGRSAAFAAASGQGYTGSNVVAAATRGYLCWR